MVNSDRLLSMRAGNTGEDWIDVYREEQGAKESVTIATSGGLASSRMTLDREEAAALRDALSAFLA